MAKVIALSAIYALAIVVPVQTPVVIVPNVVMFVVPAAATVVPPIVNASVSVVPSISISPAKSILPGIVTVELAPAPIVTSTSPSVACSPSNTKPAVNVVVVPSLSATYNDNLPASSVLSASETCATIFANVVCTCPASSPMNSILPIISPSAPAEPLSFENLKRAPFVSSVVFLISIRGSVEFADVNVTVSCVIVPIPVI